MPDELNQLEVKPSVAKRIRFGAYQLDVAPLDAGEVQAVLSKIGHLAPLVPTIKGMEDVVVLIGDHGAAVLSAAALAARLPDETVQSLMPDEAIELMLGLLEVNFEFFLPRMAQLTQRTSGAAERIRYLRQYGTAGGQSQQH